MKSGNGLSSGERLPPISDHQGLAFWLIAYCSTVFLYVSHQEIIKVREWTPHIGPLTKVIRLKLFLTIVPSSFADITRAFRGCFRGGSVYVSFPFVLWQSKASIILEMSSLIFWLQAKELRLSGCFNTFRNFNGSLNKRRMYPAQTITIEWTAEKCLDKWQTTNKPPNTS